LHITGAGYLQRLLFNMDENFLNTIKSNMQSIDFTAGIFKKLKTAQLLIAELTCTQLWPNW
jgi:hypothetical protein